VRTCESSQRLDPCTNMLAHLPRADGVVLLDAIPGLAFTELSALDAAAESPQGLTTAEQKNLNLFDPANGYNPNQNESSNYSSSFINRYTQVQAEREADLVSEAQRMSRGGGMSGNGAFPVARDAARIWQQDTGLLSHTKGRYPLITPAHPNGTVQVVRTVRVPADSPVPSSPAANAGPPTPFTAKTFVSTSAIKAPRYRLTADAIEGVDWASSNTSTVVNVAGISAPMLMMSMTAHYWIVPSEMYFQAARRSHHKTLAYVEGATHVFGPCSICSANPNEFGDTAAEVFDYVANWLNKTY
jgi:hypothetical protein